VGKEREKGSRRWAEKVSGFNQRFYGTQAHILREWKGTRWGGEGGKKGRKEEDRKKNEAGTLVREGIYQCVGRYRHRQGRKVRSVEDNKIRRDLISIICLKGEKGLVRRGGSNFAGDLQGKSPNLEVNRGVKRGLL